MAIIAKKPEGTDFVKVEPGTYVARCYSMIEVGTVDTEFQGEKKKRHEVMLTWELPTELAVFNMEKGMEPFAVSKTYTLSMHEKAVLRKDLESWRGLGFTEDEARSFDITKLLGVPCILSVIHKPWVSDATKTSVVITSISKLMKGQVCPDQVNPTRILSYDNFDWNIFEGLSDYMKDKIRLSDEFKRLQEPTTIQDEGNNDVTPSDLPF